jgi:hypothetical protein
MMMNITKRYCITLRLIEDLTARYGEPCPMISEEVRVALYWKCMDLDESPSPADALLVFEPLPTIYSKFHGIIPTQLVG